MALENLTTGTTPTVATSSATTQQNLPDWYNQYTQGLASKAAQVAANGYQQYQGPQVAGFTDAQNQAFQNVQNNQGNYQPALNGAASAANQIAPTAQQGTALAGSFGQQAVSAAGQAGQMANSSVAGQPGTFDQSYQKYMSPYTSSVVNEIGRLGNQNLMENLIPQVQGDFIGNGQFGSTRNADILGRTVRDAQTNISGLQSNALQAGYGQAGQLFNQDANRTQQQGQIQANTALNAGQLQANTGTAAGGLANQGAQINAGALGSQSSALSGLASATQGLAASDATNLAAVGATQQNQNQQGLNTNYQNFLNQQNFDTNQVANMKNAITGLPLQSGSTTFANQAGSVYGPSPLQYVGAAYGMPNTTSPLQQAAK